MVQNSEGAKKAWRTRIARNGEESVKDMQARGGKNGRTGGFAADKTSGDGLTGRERARIASALSHKIRKHNYNKDYEDYIET